MKTIEFDRWKCLLLRQEYYNGRTALQLVEVDTGEPIVTVTVNLVDTHLESDEVAINHDLSDYQVQELVCAGVICEPHRTVKPVNSWVQFRIARVCEEEVTCLT